MADVFISYSRAQKVRVAFLKDKLEALKLSVWFDARLHAGESFGDEIKREIEGARAVLVAWEKGAVASEWVVGEATLAKQRGKLVPCLIESADLEPPFNVLHTEDLSTWEGEDTFAAWLKVLERIGDLTDRPGLSSYVQIVGEGANAKPLRDWAAAYGDDPLAAEAWERLAVLESEGARARLTRERQEARARDRRRKATRAMLRRVRSAARKRSLGRRLIIGVLALAAVGGAAAMVAPLANVVDREVQLREFVKRRSADGQANLEANERSQMWLAINELGRRVGDSERATELTLDGVVESVRRYLQWGKPSFDDETTIRRAALAVLPDADPATRELIKGAGLLIEWDNSGSYASYDGKGLPEPLAKARAALEAASQNADLAPLAWNGLAQIAYVQVSSQRSGYTADDCNRLLDAVAASGQGASPPPMPLYWRAQCQRNTGHPREALQDYAELASRSGEYVNLTLQMNALHGVGTTLIATFDSPMDAKMTAALAVAQSACQPLQDELVSRRMRMAIGCLNQAIALRRQLRQSNNQIGGTAENIGFAYLRDHNFVAAYLNAADIEISGLFAWNELVRAITADRLGYKSERDEARRNISFFAPEQFGICALRTLMDDELYAEAVRLIGPERLRDIACDGQASASATVTP